LEREFGRYWRLVLKFGAVTGRRGGLLCLSADRHTLHNPSEPPLPPHVSPARSAPLWDTVDWNQASADAPENGELAPEFQFYQTVSW